MPWGDGVEPVHILMVDDEEDFLRIMQKRLSIRSFQVSTAADGHSALATVRRCVTGSDNERIDAIILDVLMPGMDGLETLQQIKTIAPKIPVIMLSGHVAMDVALEGLNLGAYDYVLKPVDIDKLTAKVNAAIRSAA